MGVSNTVLFPSFREGVPNGNVAINEKKGKRTKGEHKNIVLCKKKKRKKNTQLYAPSVNKKNRTIAPLSWSIVLPNMHQLTVLDVCSNPKQFYV